MAFTYAIGGHLPFRFGLWREDHDPGDGNGPRPGHVLYEAMPGATVHEGWIADLGARIDRLIHQGILVQGPKSKDAPATPPAEMIRGFAQGTPQSAPEGHPLRDSAPAAPAPAPEPSAEPAPEPVQAAESETPPAALGELAERANAPDAG